MKDRIVRLFEDFLSNELIVMSGFIVASGIIALEIGIPTAIAELLAGMTANRFISFEDTGVMDVLADIGILTLMYLAGLEIDMDQLRQSLRPSIVIGSLSFLFPFISLSVLSAHILSLGAKETALVAIALSTTSIAIVYPALCQSSISRREQKTILSAAMITDLLSMMALGVISVNWSPVIILVILGLFLFTSVFPLFGKKIFSHYKGNVAEFEFKIILLILLVMAIVSQRAGIDSAIIAFLLGMVSSEIVVKHEDLQTKLRGITFGLLAPIFFFSVGFSIDVMDLVRETPLLLTFLLTGFIAKYVGTYIGTSRYLPRRGGYVSSLFNSNLTLGIIAAELGLRSGILEKELYSAIVGAVVLSTIFSAIFYRKKVKKEVLQRTKRYNIEAINAAGEIYKKSMQVLGGATYPLSSAFTIDVPEGYTIRFMKGDIVLLKGDKQLSVQHIKDSNVEGVELQGGSEYRLQIRHTRERGRDVINIYRCEE